MCINCKIPRVHKYHKCLQSLTDEETVKTLYGKGNHLVKTLKMLFVSYFIFIMCMRSITSITIRQYQ